MIDEVLYGHEATYHDRMQQLFASITHLSGLRMALIMTPSTILDTATWYCQTAPLSDPRIK